MAIATISRAPTAPMFPDAVLKEASRPPFRFVDLFAGIGLPSSAETIALVHTFIVGAGVLHHARADDEARAEAQAAMRFILEWLVRVPRRRKPRVRKQPAGASS